MLLDSINAIKASLYERINSPFFSTFFISWSIVNHKIWIIILSSMSPSDKIEYLNSISPGSYFYYSIAIPLSMTMFYLFLYPHLEIHIYEVWRENQNQLKKIKVNKDEEKPIGEEEARILSIKHIDLQRRFDGDLQVLRDQNSNLIERLGTLDNEWSKRFSSSQELIQDLQKSISDKDNKINESGRSINSYIKEVSSLKGTIAKLEKSRAVSKSRSDNIAQDLKKAQIDLAEAKRKNEFLESRLNSLVSSINESNTVVSKYLIDNSKYKYIAANNLLNRIYNKLTDSNYDFKENPIYMPQLDETEKTIIRALGDNGLISFLNEKNVGFFKVTEKGKDRILSVVRFSEVEDFIDGLLES